MSKHWIEDNYLIKMRAFDHIRRGLDPQIMADFYEIPVLDLVRLYWVKVDADQKAARARERALAEKSQEMDLLARLLRARSSDPIFIEKQRRDEIERRNCERAAEIAREERLKKYVPPSPYRTRDIVALRREGKTFREIGVSYGLTRDRIRQIVLKYEAKERKLLSRADRSRPIDMGGPRDVWLEFTPQSQFYEDQYCREMIHG